MQDTQAPATERAVSAAALPKLHRVTVGFGLDGPNVGATTASTNLTAPKRTEIKFKLFYERLTLRGAG
jgi:hypothetical protein